MKKESLTGLLTACLIPFFTIVAMGLVMGLGRPAPTPVVSPAVSSSRSVPISVSSSEAPPLPAVSTSDAAVSSSAPLPESFSFTNAELLQFVQEEMGYDFLYHGSFQDQGLWADWIAMDTSQQEKPGYGRIKVTAYAREAGGPTEAIRLEGSVKDYRDKQRENDILSVVLQACTTQAKAAEIHDALNSLQVLHPSYKDSSLRAISNGYRIFTLLAAGSSLDSAALDALSPPPFSILYANRALYKQVDELVRQYRHGELADLLTASFTEEERAQDTVLPLLIAASRRAAALEAECEIDRTIPSELLIYSPGVTALSDRVCVVPRIQGNNLYVEAGFYAANDTPFTSLNIAEGKQYAYFSCNSNDITQLALGRYLKSCPSASASWQEFNLIGQMEAPVARFSGDRNVRMCDQTLTPQELTAFKRLGALWSAKKSVDTLLDTCRNLF